VKTPREEANPLVRMETRANQKHSSTCDFSAFKPVRISDWLPQGVSKRVKPSYPPEAQIKGVHGRVLVQVLINDQGEVEQVCGIGDSLLTRAAEVAALEWRFKPPVLNGSQRFPYIQDFLTFDFILEEQESKTTR